MSIFFTEEQPLNDYIRDLFDNFVAECVHLWGEWTPNNSGDECSITLYRMPKGTKWYVTWGSPDTKQPLINAGAHKLEFDDLDTAKAWVRLFVSAHAGEFQ